MCQQRFCVCRKLSLETQNTFAEDFNYVVYLRVHGFLKGSGKDLVIS